VRKPIRLSIEELAPCITNVPEPPETFDWLTLFGNSNPVEMEIGFGKGWFLLNATQVNPHINYFGIEIIRKYQLYTATRLAKRKLTNVKVCCADAKLVVSKAIVPGSLKAVNIFFPDPWWKKRHHKRRLFDADFVQSIPPVLMPGGWINIATDVEEYFKEITALFAEKLPYLVGEPWGEDSPDSLVDGHLTNFERKFVAQGKPIHHVRYRKPM